MFFKTRKKKFSKGRFKNSLFKAYNTIKNWISLVLHLWVKRGLLLQTFLVCTPWLKTLPCCYFGITTHQNPIFRWIFQFNFCLYLQHIDFTKTQPCCNAVKIPKNGWKSYKNAPVHTSFRTKIFQKRAKYTHTVKNFILTPWAIFYIGLLHIYQCFW